MQLRSILVISLLGLFVGIQAAESCTGFVASKEGRVLVGNNEDYFNPKTKLWFKPATEGKYGGIFFGFDNLWPQGGMNDRGLFFDGFATDPNPIRKSSHKPPLPPDFLHKVMAECATTAEVEEWFSRFNLATDFERGMLLFADPKGDSIIIEGDDVIHKKGDYQICTNFYQSKIPFESITCWRYLTADKALKDIQEISIDLFREILKAAHVDITQYSNIYDLNNGVVYLFHFHNFDNMISYRLEDELTKGYRVLDIAEQFPPNPEFIARYHQPLNPTTNKSVLFFLIACGLIFALTLFTMPVEWLIRTAEAAEKEFQQGADPDRLAFIWRLCTSCVCFLFLIYLIALTQFTQVFSFGLPSDIASLSFQQKVLIFIPAFNFVLLVILFVLFLIVWKRKYGSVWSRWLYTLSTIAACAVLYLIHA